MVGTVEEVTGTVEEVMGTVVIGWEALTEAAKAAEVMGRVEAAKAAEATEAAEAIWAPARAQRTRLATEYCSSTERA